MAWLWTRRPWHHHSQRGARIWCSEGKAAAIGAEVRGKCVTLCATSSPSLAQGALRGSSSNSSPGCTAVVLLPLCCHCHGYGWVVLACRICQRMSNVHMSTQPALGMLGGAMARRHCAAACWTHTRAPSTQTHCRCAYLLPQQRRHSTFCQPPYTTALHFNVSLQL